MTNDEKYCDACGGPKGNCGCAIGLADAIVDARKEDEAIGHHEPKDRDRRPDPRDQRDFVQLLDEMERQRGDKYETARAAVVAEYERVENQRDRLLLIIHSIPIKQITAMIAALEPI